MIQARCFSCVSVLSTLLLCCAPSDVELSSVALCAGQQNLHKSDAQEVAINTYSGLSNELADLLHLTQQGTKFVPIENLEFDEHQRVLVQLSLVPGTHTRLLDLAQLALLGVSVRRVGETVVDVWSPIDRLPQLAQLQSVVSHVRTPRRPYTSVGDVQTQAVGLCDVPPFFCRDVSGATIHIAVVDLNFQHFADAHARAEIGQFTQLPEPGNSVHGTACAEIICDMAPGVVVNPVAIQTLADLQSFVASLSGSPVSIISDSLVWVGDSFADGTGPHCSMVDDAANAGVAWVTSAGNHGYGSHYSAFFVDQDDDSFHEFAPDDELNDIWLESGAAIAIEMDWNDYPLANTDLDLILYRLDGDSSVEVARSSQVQDGRLAPSESIRYRAEESANYGIAVVSRSSQLQDMQLRLFLFPADAVELQYWQPGASLLDAAQCEHAITVGAITASQYAGDDIWRSSSQGPTSDARIKPDIVAPTAVSTWSYGTFDGTSAAAPHVASAIALYMQATGLDALDAADLLLHDAVPLAQDRPNNLSGFGKLMLQRQRAGWQCEPTQQTLCTTSCGTPGTNTCSATCRYDDCVDVYESCEDGGGDCEDGGAASCQLGDGAQQTETDACSCSAPLQSSHGAATLILLAICMGFRWQRRCRSLVHL